MIDRQSIHLSPDWFAWDIRCPVPGCRFVRAFATVSGCRNGLIKHMRTHGIRVYFDYAETKLSEVKDALRRGMDGHTT